MYLNRDFFKEIDWFLRPMHEAEQVSRYPLTNIAFDENEVLHIEVALAGFSKDEIKMELNGNILHIHGEKKPEEKKLRYVQDVIKYKDFSRSIILNDSYVGSEIDANYENGILTITVKPKPDVRKLIQIN